MVVFMIRAIIILFIGVLRAEFICETASNVAILWHDGK